jgi:hypothetical protein
MVSERMNLTVTTGPLLFLLALSLLAAAAPMSDEDVVRLYISGSAVDEIIEQINSSEVAFDLSEEMLHELRLAGLPAELIEAMIARQAETDGDDAPPGDDKPAAGASLRIRINPAGEGEQRDPLRVIDLIDEATSELLRLRTADPIFTDMAIFVACRTQDHVPDQWRSKSPLGRDFISVQRHRMLYFILGAEQSARRGRTVLELDLPPEIEIELEPDVAHDLTLGIALRTEGRFYLVASDDLDGLVLQEGERVLEAEFSGGRDLMPSSLKVKIRN